VKTRKIREVIGVLVAVVLIVLFAAVGAAVAGWDIPLLSDITDALGIGTA
jgi:hypothetical protein